MKIRSYQPGGIASIFQGARDAKIGAVGAQQVRDLYAEGKNEEAQALAKEYMDANKNGIKAGIAGGLLYNLPAFAPYLNAMFPGTPEFMSIYNSGKAGQIAGLALTGLESYNEAAALNQFKQNPNVGTGAVALMSTLPTIGGASYQLVKSMPAFKGFAADQMGQIFANINDFCARLAIDHPQFANKVLNKAEKYFPNQTSAFTKYVNDLSELRTFGITNVDANSFHQPRYWTREQTDPYPSFAGRMYWNGRFKLPIGGYPTTDTSFYTSELKQAVARGLYSPYMTTAQKRNYLRQLPEIFETQKANIYNLNQNATARELEAQLEDPRVVNLYKKYLNFREQAEKLGISLSDEEGMMKLTNGEWKNLGEEAKNFKFNWEALNNMSKESFDKLAPHLKSFVERAEIAENNYKTNTFDFGDEPTLRIETNKEALSDPGYFSPYFNQIIMNPRRTYMSPRILRSLRFFKGAPIYEQPMEMIAAHEFDHWVQDQIPFVNIEQHDFYHDPTENYYLPTSSHPLNSETKLFEYPASIDVNGKRGIGWQGAPLELRAEAHGWMATHGLDPDPSKWTQKQLKEYTDFMNMRFSDLNKYYKQELMNLNLNSNTNIPNINDDAASVGLMMHIKGFKNGGSLNYLNYANRRTIK